MAGKGDKDDDKIKKLRNQFKDQHIDGKHKAWKPVNQAGDFNDKEKRYKSVRHSGDPKGSRVPGSLSGQTKCVVDNVKYRETGKKNFGKDGTSSFMVTGKKAGKTFTPHHLDGPATKNKNKKYNHKTNDYSECSSSSSAGYD